MKSIFSMVALIALSVNFADAIDLKTMNKAQTAVRVEEAAQDGPTNGDMADDEKDTLIQVLCPGYIQTSFSQAAGKSSTCNNGVINVTTSKKSSSLVQQEEEQGDVELQ